MNALTDGINPVTVASILADPQLRLQALFVPEDALEREIRWVTVTEMVDPGPYLIGDELILTLGISWPTPDHPDIRRFVERIAAAGVVCVGLQLGDPHTVVPDALYEAAREFDLALILIPPDIRFRQVSEYVVNQTVGDRYAVVRRTLELHESLTDALLSKQGLHGLIARLRNVLDAPVAVIDYYGAVVSSQPHDHNWPVSKIISARQDIRYGSIIDKVTVFPVNVANQNVAFVVTEEITQPLDVIRFSLGLVALEFSRQQAAHHGRRELIGQTISDLVQGDISDGEAERRLKRVGIDTAEENCVMIVELAQHSDRLVDVPWSGDAFLPQYAGEYLVSHVEDSIAIIFPAAVSAEDLAAGIKTSLRHLGKLRIGIGGIYPGVTGLRVSWFEAQESMMHQGEVRPPMSLSRLMLANLKVPLRHIGEEILRPLLDYDADHDGQLIRTLNTFVENDCQSAAAAEKLFIHRNTLRYRLQLIEKLTHRDLGSFADLVNLYLAVLALDMGE